MLSFTSHHCFFSALCCFWKSKTSRDLSEKQEGVIEISCRTEHHGGLACRTYNGNHLVFYQLPAAPEKGHIKEVQKKTTKLLRSCEADLRGTLQELSTCGLATWWLKTPCTSTSLQRGWSQRRGEGRSCPGGENIAVPALYLFCF